LDFLRLVVWRSGAAALFAAVFKTALQSAFDKVFTIFLVCAAALLIKSLNAFVALNLRSARIKCRFRPKIQKTRKQILPILCSAVALFMTLGNAFLIILVLQKKLKNPPAVSNDLN
jgi:hypothetical protein